MAAPVILYGFDSSFLDFFGERGVQAVDQAMEILNKIPDTSRMSRDLTEFPLDTRRFNYAATALGIYDVKSTALAHVLEQMGLTAAERYVWALRSRVPSVIDPNIFIHVVIKRNFDPVTYEPSSYVNGTLFTYRIDPLALDAVEVAVDPLAPSGTSVSAITGINTDRRGAVTLLSPGLFYTGLTRDDVGGLRYLYSSGNINMQNLPTNAVGGAYSGSGTRLGEGGGSPWVPVSGGGGQQAGAGGVGGAGGGTATNGVPVVVTAPRPGASKIRFERVSFDTTFGQFVTNVVTYTDKFLTNSSVRQQVVSRVTVQPDIVFTAADLGLTVANVPVRLTRTTSFVNNDGIAGVAGRPILNGPGQIDGGVFITLTKIGPWLYNVGDTTEEAGVRGYAWGSFDGSTNAPVVYPSGASIRDLERGIFQGGSSPFTIGQ